MKAIKHFLTITRHRREVRHLCFKCGIGIQGLFHDLSKYSPSEFLLGVKYYTGTKSPNEGERLEYGYSKAWLHHKGRNKHHFEYWFDYNMAKRRVEPVRMPLKYTIEMFCDRVAASRIYRGKDYTDDYPLFYFMRGKANRVMNEETSDTVERWLGLLAEKGEDYTCGEIKKELKNERNKKNTDK